MKRATFTFALLATAVFFVAAPATHRWAAAAATPTPAALQYDEINRFAIPPATPPPPGSFQEDFRVAMAEARPSPPPPRKRGFGGLLNAVVNGNVADQAVGEATQSMLQLRNGRLRRYTFYKGWIRVEDPVAQTATIEKCDRHQFVTLNLAKKTYTTSSTQAACPTPAMPVGRPQGRPAQEDPGTVDMTVKTTAANLGPLTIDGIATTGSNDALEMSMTNATGSCKNADMRLNVVRYVSSIAVPRPYCPLPRAMGPADMATMRDGGGCKPTFHGQTAGAGDAFSDGSRLVLYRRMTIAQNGGVNVLDERGNVAWLSGQQAEALFAIAPDFTQQ
jgi:hypothetical protein